MSGIGDDLETLTAIEDLLGTRIEDREQDVVLREPRRLRDRDDALAGEVVGHAARIGHGAAVAGHEGAHVGRRTIAVIGQTLDQESDTVRPVALVHDRLVVD